MSAPLAWGIIGTGRIAQSFAENLKRSRTGQLVAVASRTQAAADAFRQRHQIPFAHGDYQALLDNPRVQAVYIATPHPMHADWAIRAAEAGKHILCEKPLTMNRAEAMAVIEAAREHDVFLMEAFMYRCHPQTAKIIELIRGGVLGQIRALQAVFSFHVAYDPASRLFAAELGGGAILDVGCYCTSMARLIAGLASGQPFAEPLELAATGELCPTGVDTCAAACARFPGGVVAQLATGVQVYQETAVRIYGTDAWLHVPSPWAPARSGGESRIYLHRGDSRHAEEIVVPADRPLFAIEADHVAADIAAGRREATWPGMTWDDTLGNMRMLDRWRAAVGVVYPDEKPDAHRPTVHRRPLRRRPDAPMTYGRLRGIALPVAWLILGANQPHDLPTASVMWDDYFEQGGNCFDTAHIYGRGFSERLLGRWIANRGIREQVVILDKGAHTPWCTPKDLSTQLIESLERLQTDYIDLYMLHRDNLEVPVGEFIEVLNEHRRAGHIRAFGVSNWSIARIEEANDYARARDLDGLCAVSNQFSLARMVAPPWPGCRSASDAESRQWHTQTQMPLLPWSSQARGFFSGMAAPDRREDPELVRCWYSPDNFQRLERARELAARKGVEPINIALAFVLCQPFPVFPIIGPRSLREMRLSLVALSVELTPEEMYWLNLDA